MQRRSNWEGKKGKLLDVAKKKVPCRPTPKKGKAAGSHTRDLKKGGERESMRWRRANNAGESVTSGIRPRRGGRSRHYD